MLFESNVRSGTKGFSKKLWFFYLPHQILCQAAPSQAAPIFLPKSRSFDPPFPVVTITLFAWLCELNIERLLQESPGDACFCLPLRNVASCSDVFVKSPAAPASDQQRDYPLSDAELALETFDKANKRERIMPLASQNEFVLLYNGDAIEAAERRERLQSAAEARRRARSAQRRKRFVPGQFVVCRFCSLGAWRLFSYAVTRSTLWFLRQPVIVSSAVWYRCVRFFKSKYFFQLRTFYWFVFCWISTVNNRLFFHKRFCFSWLQSGSL